MNIDANNYVVLITGSRNWRDVRIIRGAIIETIEDKPLYMIRLVHGNQRGADQIAAFIARQLRIPVIKSYPAKWNIHGLEAGTIRNQQMLNEEDHIDVVLAFPLYDSTGTCDMLRRAKAHGIRDIRIFGNKGCFEERNNK